MNCEIMKIANYISVVAIAASLLSSCGLYKSYQSSPDEQIIEALYDYAEPSGEQANLASIKWQELFTDPYLATLIEQALESNVDLSVARLNAEQAQIALSTARKAFLPSLSATPQYSVSSYGGASASSYNVGLTASWEIDVFGSLRNAKAQSQALLEQSEAYAQAIQTQVVAAVAGSYYSLLMLDEQLEISEQTKVNWAENLRVMQALKSAGRINETSVLQSEASCVALNSQIVTLREQIAAMENTISLLISQPTATIERGTLSESELSADFGVGLPIELLGNRPDVRMAESGLAAAFYATAESRSALYPSITLSGSAGYTNSVGTVANPADMLYSAVASLVQPIFNRGVLKGQVKISEAQQQQALLSFNQAILEAGAEVNNALSECQSAQERLEYSAEQIELLERAVTKTELLMQHGAANSLEVLTAQLSLLQSELSMSADRYNLSQGVINLYRALGGGE